MRRCTTCFRYARGHPTYCPTCGRSYGVRICSRGHVNARSVQFCTQCGSDQLSTPSAAESFASRLSHAVMLTAVTSFVGITALALSTAIIASVNWRPVLEQLASLALMLVVLYWTTTLLPGPVKKVGRVVGRNAAKAVRDERKNG